MEEWQVLESDVKKIVNDIIANKPDLTVLYEPEILGVSGEKRRPDIVIISKEKFGDHPRYFAMIQVKYTEEGVSYGTYQNKMGLAYMELNDLQLNWRIHTPAIKFYLVVNRYPKEGEKKVKYPEVFKAINVKIININDSYERAEFEDELRNQLPESYDTKAAIEDFHKALKNLELRKEIINIEAKIEK